MKSVRSRSPKDPRHTLFRIGFTLIELLVVIAIIASLRRDVVASSLKS